MKFPVKTKRPRRKKSVDIAALLAKNEDPLFSGSEPISHDLLKRLFDITFALFALIVTAPIWILCALLIPLTSIGPAIFVSTRIGRGGRIIHCYKLRTMYADAEQRLKDLLEECPKRASEYLTHRKLINDPRITALGRFLRRYSIDELPQFFNVLRGDLSIVGPRPYFARELKELTAKQRDTLLCMRPGITGPWQTGGRSEIPFKERVAIETSYAERATFGADLLYVAKTLPAILFPKGAR